MTTLIADCETDNLLPAMTKVWMIQLGDANTDEVTVYADQPGFPPISEALARLQGADEYVFHHGLGFDMDALNKIYPGAIVREKLLDTLVMARLKEPEERDHSLKAWGKRLGAHKGDYTGDFQSFTPDLVEYAKQDIVVGRALYHKVKEVRGWGSACALEHAVAHVIIQQERNGFAFDVAGATALEGDLRGEQQTLADTLRDTFPPIWVPLRSAGNHIVHTPKVRNTKAGTSPGAPYTKVVREVFNPQSRQHVAKRLKALGWVSKVFTPDGRPQVDEKTLASLKAPEAVPLRRYFRLAKMLGMISDGKAGWLRLVKPDGRIYGRVNPNGALTGRMTHSRPNVAQTDKDPRMRALWLPRKGWKLVGCDAEGIEARMLAHYLVKWDKGAFADRLLNGDKAAGTDVHSANSKAVIGIGLPVTRDAAKVLLYALMYGAGDPKLGNIVLEDLRSRGAKRPALPAREIGALVRMALAKSMTGIDKLAAATATRTKAKLSMTGLDGRQLRARAANSSLNTLLQSAGAVAMKVALKLFWDRHGSAHGKTWAFVVNVHDEVQMECEPEIAEAMGKSFAACITQAGVDLKVKCPLAGAFAVGDNWSSTH